MQNGQHGNWLLIFHFALVTLHFQSAVSKAAKKNNACAVNDVKRRVVPSSFGRSILVDRVLVGRRSLRELIAPDKTLNRAVGAHPVAAGVLRGVRTSSGVGA